MTAALTISESGTYQIPVVDATGYTDGIVVTCSNVNLYVGEVFGASRHGFMTSNVASASQPAISNIHVHCMHTHDNGQHGAVITGKTENVFFFRCIAEDNGLTAPGHGFSTFPSEQHDFVWEAVGGIYRAPINIFNKAITRVIDRTATDLVRGTYTALGAGEWDISNNYLYVNYDTAKTLHATNEQVNNIRFIECISMRTLKYVPTGQEGHGFALDDFTRDSWVIDCQSFDNEGGAMTNNGGRRNHFISGKQERNQYELIMLDNCIDTEIVGLSYTGDPG